MSDQERYEIAKAYVDKQMKTMEKNGLKVKKVSASEYDQIVKNVAANVTSSGQAKSATGS
jgi:hypothetical protein